MLARVPARSCASARPGDRRRLLVSQMLTLFTTPVIYIWFDGLVQRFSRHNGDKLAPEPPKGAVTP